MITILGLIKCYIHNEFQTFSETNYKQRCPSRYVNVFIFCYANNTILHFSMK